MICQCRLRASPLVLEAMVWKLEFRRKARAKKKRARKDWSKVDMKDYGESE